MQVLKAGALYFAVVLAAGFVLGMIRVLWVVPRFGERAAELMKAPIMLGVIVLAGYRTVRRLTVSPAHFKRLGIGIVALGPLLGVENRTLRARRVARCRGLVFTVMQC